MKVGDLVRQSGCGVVELRHGSTRKKAPSLLGIVVALRAMGAPRPEETERLRQMMNMLGRCVDVFWSTGRLTKNFAENSLEVISAGASE